MRRWPRLLAVAKIIAWLQEMTLARGGWVVILGLGGGEIDSKCKAGVTRDEGENLESTG